MNKHKRRPSARKQPKQQDIDRNYDLTDAFRAEISPLVDQLTQACHKLGLPCMIMVPYRLQDDGENETGETCLVFQGKGERILLPMWAALVCFRKQHIPMVHDMTQALAMMFEPEDGEAPS